MTAQVWNAYCGAAPVPGELLSRWNLDPALLAGLLLAVLFLHLRFGSSLRYGRLGAAMLLLLLLFVSPFCALTAALFSARVLDHVLLTAAVAPLLVASIPGSAIGRWRGLAVATAVQAAIFWMWHAPALYAWALSSDAGYWLMQLSLLAAALGFWAAVRGASVPAAVAALLATMVQMGLLGALITFASAPLYAPHLATTQAWTLSPLEDQQLAGLIMWAPAAGLYLAAALVLAGRWLGTGHGEAPAR